MSKNPNVKLIASLLVIATPPGIHADAAEMSASAANTGKSIKLSESANRDVSEIKSITVAPYRITRYSTAHGKWGATCNWHGQPALTATCNKDITTASPFKSGDRLSFEVKELFIGDFKDLQLPSATTDSNNTQIKRNTPAFMSAGGVIFAESATAKKANTITTANLTNLPPSPKRAILTTLIVNLKGYGQLGYYQTITLAYDDMSDSQLRQIHYEQGVLRTMRLKDNVDADNRNSGLMK